MPATTTTQAADAVAALTQAIALLTQAGTALPLVKMFTEAAADTADIALMTATNELRLAERGL